MAVTYNPNTREVEIGAPWGKVANYTNRNWQAPGTARDPASIKRIIKDN